MRFTESPENGFIAVCEIPSEFSESPSSDEDLAALSDVTVVNNDGAVHWGVGSLK